MNQTDDKFFREATLRICGSLEIERALYRSFIYIKEFIPSDAMHLYIFDAELGVLKSVASAAADGGACLEMQTPLSPGARQKLESGNMPHVFILARMKDDEIGGPVADSLGISDSAGLVMVLRSEDRELGALFVSSREPGRYSPEHAQKLALLNEPFAIALSNCLRYREVIELRNLLADDNKYLHNQMRRLAGEQIIGADFGLKGVMELAREVAPLSSAVLLLGETGTGKEIIAGAIHDMSPRRGGPFIKVNCGAIPQSLMDSELFGYEKGAFTGALSRKRGLFERAQGGTIFLDEIGELTHGVQVRLLRVLQEKEIERVGGDRPIKLDIRVISATHRDLQGMIKNGEFRQDLYFRLQVFPIVIPPLRDRIGDISVLVPHIIQKKSREIGLGAAPPLAPGAMDRLLAYHWPGNVRELENAVERALITSKGEPLAFHDIQSVMVREARVGPEQPQDEDLSLDALSARHIRRVLAMTGGRVEGDKGAALLLGINPSTLRNRMRRLGIPFGRKAILS